MGIVEASSVAPRGERSARWAGIAFVALSTLWVVVVSIVEAPQLSQATTQEFASFYDDQGNRISLVLASLGLALAGFAFLWFLGGLRGVLRRAEGEGGTLSTAVVVSGAILVGLLFVFNAINVAVAWALEESDNFQFDPNSAQLSRDCRTYSLSKARSSERRLSGPRRSCFARLRSIPHGWRGAAS